MKKSDNRYLDILKKNEKCLWDAADVRWRKIDTNIIVLNVL